MPIFGRNPYGLADIALYVHCTYSRCKSVASSAPALAAAAVHANGNEAVEP